MFTKEERQILLELVQTDLDYIDRQIDQSSDLDRPSLISHKDKLKKIINKLEKK